jgi:hypothetical protein
VEATLPGGCQPSTSGAGFYTRYMVHGAWCMVHGAWCMGHGAWGMGHGAWCMVHGAWCMVHGAWGMVHGAWCMVHGACCMVHGAWCMVHGAWCMDLRITASLTRLCTQQSSLQLVGVYPALLPAHAQLAIATGVVVARRTHQSGSSIPRRCSGDCWTCQQEAECSNGCHDS